MSIEVAQAAREFPIDPQERQLALCKSALNNALFFNDVKPRNQWAHCRK